ncbi:GvpL/GvpF family gas vesicle protein [bacterium]|nr:GvpL/GvpF family gas vesicle protein [bacterium]
MEKEGKYIYCIIDTKQERNFGPIGIGGRGDEVLTIGYDDLSMIVSSCPMTKFIVSRENMLAHMRVIEKVMNEFDSVLPVRFGTVAFNADEIRNLLDRRLREFRSLLRNMDHKVELGVKGSWKNMKVIFEEIIEENREIKKAKEKIQNEVGKKNIPAKTEVGKMVEEALKKKKEREAEKIVDALRRTAFEYKLNKIIGDEMFVNAAFLVDKGWEKEFDNIIEDLSERYRDRVKFVYVGPVPVYSFVNIVIYPEEWEK